ncbi:MAG: sugar ABC transporter substrate-binding protein [Spirochaetales bacterium]|nr:sugar ABC transporter substrate-binding protein [Spirochaetales bacterium]
MRKIITLMLILSLVMFGISASAATERTAKDMTRDADGIAWRQFEVTELHLGMNKHVYTETIRLVIDQFEAKTGIKVIIEDFAQDEFMNKRLVDLSSGAGTFDLVMMDSVCTQAAQAGWIENLDEWFKRSDLVNIQKYRLDDIAQSWKIAFTVNGNLYAIPVSGEKQMLFYRKDIFEQHGIKVPTTFDEVEEAARYFKKIMPAGILLRGQKIHTVSNCTGVIWSFGGRIADSMEYNMAVFNSPEAVAGADMYTRLARNYGPRGIENYTWYECVTDFQQGLAPMYLDMSVFMSQFEDPSQSTVAGKVGYAPMPAGPAGSKPTGGAWAMSMSSSSKHKEAAFLLLQWLTCPETCLDLALKGGISARVSAFASPELAAAYPADWLTSFSAALAAEVPEVTFPLISKNEEYLDVIGTAFNALIQKEQPVKPILDKACTEVTALFKFK